MKNRKSLAKTAAKKMKAKYPMPNAAKRKPKPRKA